MRRSICICEPPVALAGEVSNWKFSYTTAINLHKGARLKFDLGSPGREIDWQVPQTSLKKSSNVIYVRSGKHVIAAHEVAVPESFVPHFEFTLPAEVHAGDIIDIILGASPGHENNAKGGNRAQTTVQRRRPFLLYIDPKGVGNYKDPELFSLDIRGNKLDIIRILVPSFVSKNKRFDVTIRFEDEHGNLTANAPEGTLIELSYENLRENLNWKLFVPETGFVVLPNLYFNEAGIYKIQLTNLKSGEKFLSAPIKCFSENEESLFWGTLHGESERVDSTENIENCLRHFRDDKGLQFYGVSNFESAEETSNDLWKLVSHHVADFNEDDRFVALPGMQWAGEAGEEGIRLLVYSKDQKPIIRKKDSKTSSLSKIYKNSSPKELLSIPSFTMGKGVGYNFNAFSSEFERVVEIYNAWGSSECTKAEGNTRPIHSSGKIGVQEDAQGSIQKALRNNHRFGFIAGGLDDRGIYAELFAGDQVQYSPGLTAIVAKTHSRDGLWNALHAHSCYATTGERIILSFNLSGHAMGTELSTETKPGLTANRHFSGFVVGTTPLKTVEILRNGVPIKTYKPDGDRMDYSYDDMDELDDAALQSPDQRPPFVYYYLRVTQADGHLAWSSPIWIDVVGKPMAPVVKKAAKASKKK